MKRYILILLGIFSISSQSFGWWNEDWSYQKKLDVDITGLKAEGETFPVLIRLSTGNFGYFYDVMPKGEDLRFIAADDKTPLKYHIEKFDPVAEMALIWLEVPRTGNAVTSGSITTETVYMYYGNPSAVKGDDKKGSYDINQVMVYHFDVLAQAPSDATAYNNNPVNYQGETNTAGIIGNSVKFSPTQGLLINSSPSMRFVPQEGWTMSFWFNVNEAGQEISNLVRISSGARSIDVTVNGLTPSMSVREGESVLEETAITKDLALNTWHHMALVLNAEQISLLIDGQPSANIATALTEMDSNILFGKTDFVPGVAFSLDELKVSNIARPTFWFKKIFDNQAIGSDIVVYGADESIESGTEGYFVGILKSVSLDGWVVIFLLGIMAAISWVVAVGKAIVISGVNKDNKAFIEKFRLLDQGLDSLDREETKEDKEMADDPLISALFGKHDHFQSSSLYHLYHVGMREMKSRMGKSVGAASAISPEGLQVIKASLDAAMIREQQKLNKFMVLLTIAISGGPFLGLLGTVLGVMITFAAIAISGDVNINAIAPGVSAALMTTVAGLFVAIPALFAYNYLSTRIRDLAIDMQVFVDELIAKIAEQHS